MAEDMDACSVAHGGASATTGTTAGTAPVRPASPPPAAPSGDRTLVAVSASPVSGYLLRYAADAGYRTLLVEPDPGRADAAKMAGFPVLPAVPDAIEGA